MGREEKADDLARTQELFEFLQGTVPDGYKIDPDHTPKLTPEQAWTVIWYLGNQYWQVPDYVERCGVCGDLYHAHSDGTCLDFGDAPYHFCSSCDSGEKYHAKLEKHPKEAHQRGQCGSDCSFCAGSD